MKTRDDPLNLTGKWGKDGDIMWVGGDWMWVPRKPKTPAQVDHTPNPEAAQIIMIENMKRQTKLSKDRPRGPHGWWDET